MDVQRAPSSATASCLALSSTPRRRAQAKGCIKVLNNGAGIPVEVHAKEGIYVPELIFGNLLTSSNYNDNEKKARAGWLAMARSGWGGGVQEGRCKVAWGCGA